MGCLQNVSLSLILSSRFDQSSHSHEKDQARAFDQLYAGLLRNRVFYPIDR